MTKLSIAALVTAFAFVPAAAFAGSLGVDVGAATSAAGNLSTSLAGTTAGVSAGLNTGASGAVTTDSSGPGLTADAGATVNAAAAGTTGSGSTATGGSGQLTFDQLIDDLKAPDVSTQVAAIANVGGDAPITIVPISSLEGGANADASLVADAQAASADQLTKLRAAVHANAAIEAQLTAKGYTDDSVLAVKGSDSGAIWVYVAG
jgi:hypothetical protein